MSFKKFILFQYEPRAAKGCLDDIRDSFDTLEEVTTALDQPCFQAREVVDRDSWIVVTSRLPTPRKEVLPAVTSEDATTKWLWKVEYLRQRGLPAADSECWDLAERKWTKAPREYPPDPPP